MSFNKTALEIKNHSQPKILSTLFVVLAIGASASFSYHYPQMNTDIIICTPEEPTKKKKFNSRRNINYMVKLIKIKRQEEKAIRYSYLYRDVIGDIESFQEKFKTNRYNDFIRYSTHKKLPKLTFKISNLSSQDPLRDRVAIKKVITRRTPGLRHILLKYNRKNINTNGAMTLDMIIGADGKVQKSTIKNSTFKSKQLQLNLKRKLNQWRFSSLKDSDKAESAAIEIKAEAHSNEY